MRKIILTMIVIFTTQAQAENQINPQELIKVENKSNPKCVEYYTYNKELYCSTKALSSAPVDPHLQDLEKQKIIFDERPWHAAWGQDTDDMTTVEYIPNGTDIDAWKELVTSQVAKNIPQATPKEYAEMFVKSLSESGFSPSVKYHEESLQQVIFEFQIMSPENQQQDEIVKVVRKGKDFYILHYVIKESDMGDKQRELWLKNIRKSTLK